MILVWLLKLNGRFLMLFAVFMKILFHMLKGEYEDMTMGRKSTCIKQMSYFCKK